MAWVCIGLGCLVCSVSAAACFPWLAWVEISVCSSSSGQSGSCRRAGSGKALAGDMATPNFKPGPFHPHPCPAAAGQDPSNRASPKSWLARSCSFRSLFGISWVTRVTRSLSEPTKPPLSAFSLVLASSFGLRTSGTLPGSPSHNFAVSVLLSAC